MAPMPFLSARQLVAGGMVDWSLDGWSQEATKHGTYLMCPGREVHNNEETPKRCDGSNKTR